MAKFRYPGPKPFTEMDKQLFFGRTEEGESLINLIKNNRLNILFGRSGNGKSSLIHAALIPYFDVEHYKLVEIRVQPVHDAYSGERALINQVIGEFKKNQLSEKLYLEEIMPETDATSLWQYYKTLQWDMNQEGYEGIIFIIDQFEELFNFSADQYKLFTKEFSEVIYNRTPFKFQEALNEKIKNKDPFIEENTYKVDFIKADFFSSFLIGIRSDRLYLLDELGEMIPIIFNNRFRLDHLSTEKVDEAIKLPAGLEGHFASPVFTISEDVVTEIKAYLFDSHALMRQSYFETFQLQIICQFIENKVIQVNSSPDLFPGAFVDGKIVVSTDILSKPIPEIIEEYYESVIKTVVPGMDENYKTAHRLFIRYLIENKLIDLKANNRICLDRTSIDPLGIDSGLLKRLTESKIIRKEINTVSGESFEISHDSLLKPILAAAHSDRLGDLEAQLYDYYISKFQLLPLPQRRKLKGKVLPHILNKEGNLQSFKIDDFPKDTHHLIEHLTKNYIVVSKNDNSKQDYHIINEAFRNAIIRQKNKDSLIIQNLLKMGVALLIAITVVLAIDGLHRARQHQIDNSKVFLFKNVLLFSPPITETPDTIESVKKLLLLSTLYKTIKQDTANMPAAAKYLTSYFNSSDFLGRRLTARGWYPASLINNRKNQLLVIYWNHPKTMSNTAYLRQSEILFDRTGRILNRHMDIYSAMFGPKSELIALKKDSVIIFQDNKEKSSKLNLDKLLDQNKFDIASLNILSVQNNHIDFVIRATPKANATAPASQSRSSNRRQLVNPYERQRQQIIYAMTDYGGNTAPETSPYFSMELFQGPDEADTAAGVRHRKFKSKELSFDGTVITLKSGKFKKTDTLDALILDANFSPGGDSVFVNHGHTLTILDKYLKKLSNYRNELFKSNSQPFPGIVAYTQTGYVVLIDLNDPMVKKVKTLSPESIVDYIDGDKHTVSWQLLTDKDKKKYGFNNP